MSWLDGFLHRVRTVLRPESYASELDEEMRHHLELDAMQQRDAGAARRAFGNRTVLHEVTREQTWLRWTDAFRQDVGTAWRSLRRSPATTALAVVTLALGIGANAATFTVIDRLFLRPPAEVEAPNELRRYWIQHFNTGDGVPFASTALSYPMYREIARASGDSANVASYTTDFALRRGRSLDGPRVRGAYATANYFPVLGVRPALGRFHAPSEDRMGAGAPVIVLSHAYWTSAFNAAPDAVGQTLEIGREKYTIIGVAQRGFTGLDLQAVDVWIPLASLPRQPWMRGNWWEGQQVYALQAVQRWRHSEAVGVVEQRATQHVRTLNRAFHPARPDTLTNVYVGPLVGMSSHIPVKLGQDLVIATRLGGVSLIVLLIAWANVLNILLAQANRRRREIAVRLALGMSRGRLMRLLAVETMLLAIAAAIVASLFAWQGGTALRALLLPNVTWYDAAFDWRVGAFTLAIALVSGGLAGLVPALQARREALHGTIKAGAGPATSRRSRTRSVLVVTQAALSVALLVGASLFLRSLKNVEALDIGFDAEQLLFGYPRFEEGAEPPLAVSAAAAREVAERLSAHPSVTSVARSTFQPMLAIGFTTFFTDRDSTGSFPGREPTSSEVSPSFFATVGMELLAGHTFRGPDADGAPAEVVVNEAMARLVWPGREALGQCMRFEKRANPCHTVVGIVESARQSSVIESEARPQFYLPLGNSPWAASAGTTIIVRTHAGAVATATAALDAELRRAYPGSSPSVTRMTTVLEPEYRPWRLGATLFGALGALALLVALVGVYGTVAYSVGQRTREFGVRMALGAAVPSLLRQVLGEELRVIGIGVVAGIALALAAGRLLSALLFGVAPWDPLVLVAVSAGVLVAAALATLRPAWRATQVDPVRVLREE